MLFEAKTLFRRRRHLSPPAAGQLSGCLQRAVSSGVDVLVTSGGVSMGDRDLIKPLLEKMGKVHFGRVCMKPGKPLTFATLDAPSGRRMLVFGLPGEPGAAAVLLCVSRMLLHRNCTRILFNKLLH